MGIKVDRPTITSHVLLSLYNDLSAHREVVDSGLREFGISREELQDFHGQVSLRSFVQLFEWLAAELDDPYLGLRVSQRTGPDALGAVGYLFLCSGKLETAFQSLAKHLDAIQSSSRIDIRYVGDLVQIRYRIIDDTIAPRRQDSEYSMGINWRHIKLLSKNQCRLVQVSFEHELGPVSDRYYRRIFGAPVLFGREANEIALSVEDFQRWHEGLDPHLFPILEDHIANTRAHAQSSLTFTESVSQLLTERVLQQGARAEVVADMLKVSTVTLHRRLRQEGLRFKQLVDMRSKAVAERLLAHSNIPIATVSRRLGYTDPATFSRAFRRWHGVTPRDYRNQCRDDERRVSDSPNLRSGKNS